MSKEMKKYRACGLIDFCAKEFDENGNEILDNWGGSVGELLSFNVYISVQATNEEEAWEKLFAMTPEQFKKEAEPSWEDDAFEKVWIEEVEDANDGIDWYFDDVDVIEEKEKENE